jgi:Ca-activated chloride channel homolog
LVSAQDSKAFGFLTGRAIRAFGATGTSIVTAVGNSTDLLETNAFDGNRRVIDVSGDGIDNSGFDLEIARQDAKSQKIIINGLAIQEDELGLAEYYRNHLIIGPDSFVETANGYADFTRAIRAKLLKELRPNSS